MTAARFRHAFVRMKTAHAWLRMGRRAAFIAAVLANIVCRGAEVTVPTSDPVELGKIANRFQKEIYPLLSRESNHQESCVECHDTDNRSSLVLLDRKSTRLNSSH